MSFLSKKFNAETLLGELNAASEKQIAAMQSTEKGALNTLFTAGKASLKLMRTAKKLAEGLGIPLTNGVDNDLFQQIAAKAKEQNIKGAERLQQLIDWNKEFWTSDEVKNAEKTGWNFIKEAKVVKALAQKRPKP